MASFRHGLCLLVLGAASCSVDLGPRPTTAQRSFGEIVYREACQRVTYTDELLRRQQDPAAPLDASGVTYRAFCDGLGAAPPTAPQVVGALSSERATIIAATDQAVPDALLDPLDGYLRAILPLQDDGTLRQVVNSSGAFLESFSQSGDALLALSRLGWRDGFRPRQLLAGLPRALLAYPALDDSLGAVLPHLSASSPGAQDADARAEVQALLRALQAEMGSAVAVPDPRSPDRTLQIALSFLLSTNNELATLPSGQAFPAVLRDQRGLPVVDTSAGLPAPYVDNDHDGLADVDASGHFIGADKQALPDITPFPPSDPATKDHAVARDAQGQALLQNGGRPLYRYVDLDQTVLAALLRDGKALLDPDRDIPLSLLRGAAQLLGPRVATQKPYPAPAPALSYTGFDTTQAPLLDLIYGYVQLLGYSDTEDASGADARRLLLTVQALLRGSEPEMSRNLAALLQAQDEAKKPAYDAAKLADSVTLYDDLAPIIVRLLRVPGLVSDLVAALSDPAVADLPAIMSTLMNDNDYVYMNQDQLDYTQAGAVVGQVGRQVDRSKPDSDVDKNAANAQNNRSVLQRVLHLVHDANNVKMCNKANAQIDIKLLDIFPFKATYGQPCSLFEIDDLALFYLLSVTDQKLKSDKDHYPTLWQIAYFPNSLRDTGFLNFLVKVADFLGFLDGALVDVVGIPGFGGYPPPQAAARLLFISPDNPKRAPFLNQSIDPAPCDLHQPNQGKLCCNQGHGWRDDHDGVLFALEQIHPPGKPNVTFFDAFRPIVDAFAKHTECAATDQSGQCLQQRNAAKILVDMLAVLHRHWPTQQSSFYGLSYEPQNQHSGVGHYEPLIGDILTETDLWPSTLKLAPALSGLKLDDGTQGLTVISNFLRWFFDPAAPRLGGALRYRDGNATALRNDGQPAFRTTNDPFITDILPDSLKGKVTPYYLLADAYKSKRQRLAQDPEVEKKWKAAVSNAADLFLQAGQSDGVFHFQNPRFRPVSLALLDMLHGRVLSHGYAGDLASWVGKGLPGSLADSLTGPLFAAGADLSARIAADDTARRKLQLLLQYLVDPAAPTFQAVLSATADPLQLLLDDDDLVPLVHALAPAMGPDQMVDSTLGLMRRGHDHDPQQVLLTVGRNLYRADGGGLYPLFHIGDAIAEIDRSQAGAPGVFGTLLGAQDYQVMLHTVSRFLSDQQRGVSRFVDIVQSRQ